MVTGELARISATVQVMRRATSRRIQVCCFPGAGAAASAFRGLAARLREDVEVLAIQLPGRQNRLREPPFATMETAAEAIADALALSGAAPGIFLGHSMGALLAFEVARVQRQRGGSGPDHLMVAACGAPHVPRQALVRANADDASLVEALQRLGQMPPEFVNNQELQELVMPALRADLALVERYELRAEPPLDSAITALGGSGDPSVTQEGLRAWAVHTCQDCSVHLLPGDHFLLDTSPRATAIIDAVLAAGAAS